MYFKYTYRIGTREFDLDAILDAVKAQAGSGKPMDLDAIWAIRAIIQHLYHEAKKAKDFTR